ncbi:MAG: TIGR02391 family protein [Lachnospiraceae bacterium]
MPYSLKKLKGFFEVYNIHAALSDAVQLIYKSEFESAAREAFVAVENYLKKKSGLDLHGFDLATRALSFEIDKQTGEIKRAPLIAINDLKNESQRNEQDGIRYMLMGFFQGPRNLYQHNHIGSGVSNSISVIIERFIKRCPNVLIAGDRYAY